MLEELSANAPITRFVPAVTPLTLSGTFKTMAGQIHVSMEEEVIQALGRRNLVREYYNSENHHYEVMIVLS